VSDKLLQLIPAEGVKIFLTLFLAFLIGLEREEHRAAGQRYSFGGVRTFPLIGLIGYGLALLSGTQLLPLTAGFAVIGAFLWLSYRHKLEASNEAGVTTEMSGLTTYVVGALVARDQLWIATTLAVVSILLLELKEFLESLTKKIPGEEILTFTKFLLLTFVILPVVPNQEFGPFAVNPFRAWLMVVAVSGVSYGSYLLEKLSKGEGGVRLAGLLGGAYSSTFTTFVMARHARSAHAPHRYAGGILIASGVMYVRFLVLIGFFNRELAHRLLAPFLLLGALGVAGGWLWSLIPGGAGDGTTVGHVTKNPLELTAAFSFAVTFVVMLAATNFALDHLGRDGVFGLAVLSGVAPVDPFIMGLAQTAGKLTPMELAVAGVIVAAASNNLAKAILAFFLSDRKTGTQSLVLLVSLAALGLLPLIWILR
jgi:uncharacterized membrane protein (DUF4010 family)